MHGPGTYMRTLRRSPPLPKNGRSLACEDRTGRTKPASTRVHLVQHRAVSVPRDLNLHTVTPHPLAIVTVALRRMTEQAAETMQVQEAAALHFDRQLPAGVKCLL